MPKCGRCGKEVFKAEEVIAAAQTWHTDCFRCATCKTALSSSNIRDKDKEIYCNHCYGKNFGPKGYGFGGGGGVGLRGSDAVEEGKEIGSAGIDAEIQRKLNLKYDEEKERNARDWLEAVLAERFEEKTLQEALKSGERLCKAVNKVAPSIVKTINKSKFAAMQRENIAAYLAACRHMAFNKAVMFETSDLFEGNNMVLVIENIYELAKRGQRKGGLPAIKDAGGKKGGYDLSAVETGGSSTYAATSYTPTASSTPSYTPSYSTEAAETTSYTPAADETTSYTPAETTSTAPSETTTSTPAASGGGDTTFCPDCGTARDGTSKFCADCGHQFDEDGGSVAF